MPAKDYTGDGIVVHWRSERCIHSRHCVGSLGAVFDPDARPWIDVSGAGAADIAAAADGCPSRALTYTRTDGSEPGPGAQREDEDTPLAGGEGTVTVTARASGPLVVMGRVDVLGPDGDLLESSERVFLCRCGQSGRKPFCDGTHKRVRFTG